MDFKTECLQEKKEEATILNVCFLTHKLLLSYEYEEEELDSIAFLSSN